MASNIKKYHSNFDEVLSAIQSARQKVFKQVNASLIDLYWSVGMYISEQVKNSDWGKGIVEELASFILQKEPEIKGFTANNIWRMKKFYETYENLPQCGKKLPTPWTELSWSHHRRIMTLKTEEERGFYLLLSSKQNYSVRELEKLINSSTFERTMIANGNLSEQVKHLPQKTENIFKDSYIFDFLNLPKEHKEKDLQKALIVSLKDFILELGTGFSFIGEEHRLQVGNDDFYIDLLFFHRELQCLVAFELKTGKFKPQHMGQLEFYLEALDRDVKLPQENPSIGVLLCREKDNEVVEYALSRSLSPAVVADYETKLIPKATLQRKLNELYQILEKEE
jgi:predicted nuclease of restriction endonuclease-like (RecB) superfamily